MVGLVSAQQTAGLMAGLLYAPADLVLMMLAAVWIWRAPQSWDWTRRLDWPRAVAVTGLLLLALVVLATQTHNPFIYFIF
jgi:hypothetical protein